MARSKGIADIEDNDPVNIHSLFRIASITKPITAVAVLQLWEKGLIDLDKDVRVYLPDFPEKKWKFTTRQLLNHTAGIRSYKDGEFHNKNIILRWPKQSKYLSMIHLFMSRAQNMNTLHLDIHF